LTHHEDECEDEQVLISVCVATTRPDTIAATIRSIRAQEYASWELVVVGQGDIEAVRGVVQAEMHSHPQRLCFVAQTGFGLSRARNAAMKEATGDVFAWLDDDCEAAPDWLSVIADALQRRPKVGIVGGALVAPSPLRRWPRTCPAWTPAEALYDPWAHGCVRPPGFGWLGGDFAVRRDAARLIGAFDEFLGAGARFPQAEDVDYMCRAEAAGVPMLSTPRAVVHHTYGWRYGVGAVLRHQRGLARGNGALAAKFTLLGDPRGAGLVRIARRESLACGVRWWRRPVSAVTGGRRLFHFMRAYRECLRDYRVGKGGLLENSATLGITNSEPGARREPASQSSGEL
jgi:Glycosyl transferase family 2